MAHAADLRRGIEAIDHRVEADCRWGDTTASCMAVGLGPKRVDCSGLGQLVMGDVLGQTMTEPDLRHVRQMVEAADKGDMEPVAGRFVVFGRWYDIDGQRQFVPGHMGIISAIRPDKGGYDFIHAKNSAHKVVKDTWRQHLTGRVAELRQLYTVLDPADVVLAAFGRL